jgi:hypothetical protein
MKTAGPSTEQLKELYKLAISVAGLKPWNFISSDQLFGVIFPGYRDNGYVQTIGQQGDIFCVLTYLGENSLHRLRNVKSAENIMEVRSLMVFFNPMEELEDWDIQALESAGVNYMELELVPVFRSQLPGYYPWHISEEDAVILIESLKQTVEVYSRFSNFPFLDIATEATECPYRKLQNGQWVDSTMNIPANPELSRKFTINNKLVKELWKLPSLDIVFQASLFVFPATIGKHDERPSWAYMLLIADKETGYALCHEMIDPTASIREVELSIPNLILKNIVDVEIKPEYLEIREDDKLADILRQMGKRKLPLSVHTTEDYLESIEQVKTALFDVSKNKRFPAGGTEAEKVFGSESTEMPDSNVYSIKVALMGNKRIYRKIAIRGNHTLNDLHEAVFYAFDREEEHMYSFFFPASATKSKRVIMNSPEFSPSDPWGSPTVNGETDTAETTISSLGLTVKQKFYYLFDWGDEWWHELTFEGECSTEVNSLPVVTVKKGESPPQYPDFEDE